MRENRGVRRFTRLVVITHLLSLIALGVACSAKIQGKNTADAFKEGLKEGAGEGIRDLQEHFKVERPFGYEQPYVPLVVPPEHIEVWVAPHTVGPEIYVNGHWIYYRIKDWRWNPDIIQFERPGGSGRSAPPLPLHPESKPAPEGRP
ncbi:MAG: hypothetical protein HYY13_13515 [Nitrospirae bacterium]|nr:hypothetical protein [Nitrospirota bacterium]